MQSIIAQNYNIDSVINNLSALKEDTNKLNALNIIAENADDYIWPIYNNELGKLAARLQKSTDPKVVYNAKKNVAASLNNKGFYFYNKGIAYKAILYFKLSLNIQKQIGYELGTSYSLNNLGAIYDNIGDVNKALEYYLESLKIREKLNYKEGLAESYNNIGIIYNNQNDYEKAIEYHRKSLEVRKALKKASSVGLSYNNIGTAIFAYLVYNRFLSLTEKDSLLNIALENFNAGLNVYQKANDEDGIGLSYYNLGDYNLSKAELVSETSIANDTFINRAEKYFTESLKIFTAFERRDMIASIQFSLAKIYLKKGEIDKAEKLATNSFDISKQLGYPEVIEKATSLLKKIYHQQGNYSKEVEVTDLYYRMRDSVLNEKTNRVTLNKYFKYENDKKEAISKLKNEKIALEFNSRAKNQRIVLYFVLAVLFIISIFSLFLFNRFKVTNSQKEIITRQKQIVETKNHIIEEKQKEIVDSINYAKRIQNSLLANDKLISKHLKEYFILFKPKDIVSGDFYWATEHNNKFYLAVCDCTGHGVPGAFMSLLNIGFLSEAIKEKNLDHPNEILDYVRKRLEYTVSSDGQQDGMDGILLKVELVDDQLFIEYAAANNEPILISNNQIIELPKDKMPIGIGEKKTPFTLNKMNVKAGDTLYLYTDGYADQFGGDKGKKFKYKKLNELLLSVQQESLAQQSHILSKQFEDWKSNLEQVDDVLIFGIKIY